MQETPTWKEAVNLPAWLKTLYQKMAISYKLDTTLCVVLTYLNFPVLSNLLATCFP